MITSTWHVLALVLAVGSAFLFYYLIGLLNQLKSTLKTVEDTLTQLQTEVSPVINNVEGITDNFEQITGRADEIFESVQNKTSDTMNIVDSLKNSLDILKHTFFIALSQLSNYSKAWGIGFKVGVTHFKENRAMDIPIFDRSSILLAPPTIEIVDHLEYLESKPK
jgi:hypothetical protein